MTRLYLLLAFVLISPGAMGKEPAPGTNPVIDDITSHYAHSWYNFPVISGKKVNDRGFLSFKPARGYATVAVFLASWCIPCQTMLRSFQDLERKYKNRYTTFVYIFAHDLEQDAAGFIEAYKLHGNNIMASVDLMKRFHEPDLPSVYLGDRHGWLAWRKLSIDQASLSELDRFLELHTSY